MNSSRMLNIPNHFRTTYNIPGGIQASNVIGGMPPGHAFGWNHLSPIMYTWSVPRVSAVDATGP